MDRPLVTFVLTSYNQERYVGEAMKSALAQTYSPLQVVVSDDCSTDATFEAVREAAAGYEGPHEVVLNRNARNLGIGGNINRVMELAEGELIVAAGGDDVSLPTRTEELVEAWSAGGVSCVYSDVTFTEEDGVDRGAFGTYKPVPVESWQEVVQRERGVVLGCAMAWDRKVFDTFGPLKSNIPFADYTIEFRSALLGRIACVDKRLVKYRRHTSTISGHEVEEANLPEYMKRQASWTRGLSTECEGWLSDVRSFLVSHPEMRDELRRATETIAARIAFYEFRAQALEGAGGMERLRDCLEASKRVRKLGVKPVAKVGLLGASPRTYCRLQRRLDRRLNRSA